MATIETRVGRDGTRTYRAKIRLKGGHDTQTFKRLTDARRWAQSPPTLLSRGGPTWTRRICA